MANITRRSFATGLATLPLLGAGLRHAGAQAADITAGLPNRYSGATLRLLLGAGPASEAMTSLDSRFTEATGIRVEKTFLPYNDLYQKLVLDTASGSGSFDLYYFAYQWKYEIESALADLANIESEVAGAPPLDLDDYPQKMLAVYGKVAERLIGLPIQGDVTLLVWNKDAYQSAGLDPAAGPKTWEEVFQNGQKLKTAERFGYGMPAGKGIQTAVTWILLFKSLGGEYFDQDNRPMFNSEAGLGATKFMVEKLQTISPPGNLTWDFPEMLTSFSNGESAQSMMWPGGFGLLIDPAQSSVAGRFAWSPTPTVSLLGGWSLGVNKRSPQVDAAKLYAAWVTSKETTKAGSLILGWAPTRISVLSDPEAIAVALERPAVLAGLQGDVAEYPPVPQAEQIHIMIYDEVNAAAAKVKSPEQATDDLQTKVTEFMKRKGFLKS